MPKRPSPRDVKRVRFAPLEWALIEVRAAEEDSWPSTYVREAALREARREPTTAVAQSSEPVGV